MKNLPSRREEVRRIINRDGYKGNKEAFRMLLKNPTYTGKILLKAYKQEPDQLFPGLHPAIISEELFFNVQKTAARKSKSKFKPVKIRVDLPLRGSLICNSCGHKLTGSTSRGRNNSYTYYHCQHGCRERIRAKEANEAFTRYLSTITFKNEIVDLYKQIVMDIYTKQQGEKAEKIALLKHEERTVQELMVGALDKFIQDKIDQRAYNAAHSRYSHKLIEVQAAMTTEREEEFNLKSHLEFSTHLLKNLPFFCEKAPLDVKQKIIGSIFNNNLIFKDKNYRTSEINEVMRFLSLLEADNAPKKKD